MTATLAELQKRIAVLEAQQRTQGIAARDRKGGASRWHEGDLPIEASAPRRKRHGDKLRATRLRAHKLATLTSSTGLVAPQIYALEDGGGSLRGLYLYAHALGLKVRVVCDVKKLRTMRAIDVASAAGIAELTAREIVGVLRLGEDLSESLAHVAPFVKVLDAFGGGIELN
ncbi:MAG: hypothetical protein AB7G08_23895 [Hyphomicrobiaceae bacterium]